MAHQHEREADQPRINKAWLKIANDVLGQTQAPETYRHAPEDRASVDRLLALAGAIQLSGLAPSREFLQDESDEDAR
jgi:hypothetical protein